MYTKATCPLGDKHCQALDKVLTDAAAARQLANDCADCGLNMDNELAHINAAEQLASKLKAKFFPNRI